MNWNSQKIADDLKKMDLITGASIHNSCGDVDTDNILVEVEDCEDILHVRGFNIEEAITNPADCGCELIQLTDGLDSRGGLNSDEENLALVYSRIRKYFRDAGFQVVPTMDDYF